MNLPEILKVLEKNSTWLVKQPQMALIIPTPLVKPTDFHDYRLFMIAVVNVLKNYQIGNLYMTIPNGGLRRTLFLTKPTI